MGYYTKFRLEVSRTTTQYDMAMLHYGSDEDFIASLLSFNPFEDDCKWYEHTFHMEDISKKYPSVLFALYGEGEEANDLWVAYYLNGKEQVYEAVITYPSFVEE